MKYSHRSNYRKTCPHDPQTRAQLGSRLHYARLRLGWSVEDAGKYFQVTDRTWHNWEAGAHRIPFAVYKLCRVLARLELPGDAWAGWRLEGNVLITPEGRQITPQDGAWWSLLVRRAACFDAAYKDAATLRKLLMQVKSAKGQAVSGGDPLAGWGRCAASANAPLSPDRGHATVSYASLSGQPSHPRRVGAPHGNHGDNTKITGAIVGPEWGQCDTISSSWPLISDLPPKSIPLPVATASGSESLLIPSSASHLTRICNTPQIQYPQPLPRYGLQLESLPQPLPLALQPSQSSRLRLWLQQTPSPCYRLKLRKPIAPSWRSGTGATRASKPDGGGAA
jgi:transcriptional regulator with XRE-family HTH domain